MDEISEIVSTSPWPIEEFTDECILYRHCHYSKREQISKKERRHPNEASFVLREGEEALSFNWSKYANSERGSVVIALTYNRSDNYLNYKDYTFFKYPIEFLKSVDGIVNIVHNPDFKGNPSAVGHPNNKSHSLVFIESNDLAIRINLADFSKENYELAKCTIDFNTLDDEIEQLRARLNDTEYHRLWNFPS